MSLYDKPAHVLHDMLTRGEIGARELTEDVLARMDAAEPQVGAYLLETRETALAQADAVDAKIAAKEEIPFLAGIPGVVKDNICMQGMRTTAASKILETFVPPYDATVVTKLRDADAVVLGKANMDEFAMGGSTENSAYRPTHNPWDTACVPGGSSGGSAAAVAAGTAIWALGSDTGGSIRQPASFCGIVGLKPTYGRVSRYGLIAYASSLDQIGPLTRDVTDAAHLLNIIAGHDVMDATASKEPVPDYTKALIGEVKGLRIGLPKEYFISGMDAEVEAAVRKAIADFEAMGAEVREISLPHTDYAVAAYYLIAPAEAATNLERYDGVSYGARVDGEDLVDMMTRTRTEKFGAEVKRRILIGNYALSAGYYDAYYLKALKVRTLIQQDFTRAFEQVDVIMTPTAPTTAYRLGEMENPLQMYLQDISTVPVNLAGLPGISLPCGFTAAGLPIGLQIIGKPLAEKTILRAAFAYEQGHDYHTKMAPIGGNA
ncbi:Asp-tRNA(Asn)/Glu-tRNA(Gln) amidotransferase subunit GatA [Selenomonas sp. F0473]|uniref:Asp-tRNA(Asn)/Glu-tRNA(Gln) amidotransferase subunit GatA n=1 Tax=Selenomonas sp. F0473 TaxID=999423 RepID=UPI00029E3C6F|nr:Asp-tRNA(Asn)/Glu-tRNA(Gln) amidotransferase subunit GatA [Selenomonas sp. F0473]EKU71554.1 aspartyl/glutamyl-tRNA(Asn/Gln) amidotransferase, A subunit [Selenomonas sp. F0473]